MLSPDSVPICSAMYDMYLDFASLIAIDLSLMHSLSSVVVRCGSGSVWDRCFARSVVILSISGWILSLLISNQSRVGLLSEMAVVVPDSRIVSLNVV